MKILIPLAIAAILTGFSLAADEPPKNPPVKIEVAEKQIAAGVQVLDVRTKQECEKGYLKGAKFADCLAAGFLEKAKGVLDSKKPVLVYCHSGGRSEKAAKLLREAGFDPVFDLDGGITAWQKAGKPVEK